MTDAEYVQLLDRIAGLIDAKNFEAAVFMAGEAGDKERKKRNERKATVLEILCAYAKCASAERQERHRMEKDAGIRSD